METAQPTILRAKANFTAGESEADMKLFNESWVDIEVKSGGILRAAQKLLLSIYIEPDDLFELSGSKFIPVLYTFRSGNFTDEGVLYV
jgi:hypothetical protein